MSTIDVHRQRSIEDRPTALDPESPEWTLRNFEHVARSLGVIMERALETTCSGLIRKRQYDACLALRDEIKPLVDYLVHLDVQGVADGVPEDES